MAKLHKSFLSLVALVVLSTAAIAEAASPKIQITPDLVTQTTMSDGRELFCLGTEPGNIKKSKKKLYFTPLAVKYEKSIAAAQKKANRKPNEKNQAKLALLVAKWEEMKDLCNPTIDSDDEGENGALVFAETPKAESITDESATILFETNNVSKAEIRFGLAAGPLENSIELEDIAQVHSAELTGLSSATTYRAMVLVTDINGSTASEELTISTAPLSEQLTPDQLGLLQTREGQVSKIVVRSPTASSSVTFSISRGPAFLSVRNLGGGAAELTLAPSAGTAGEHTFVLAANGAGGSGSTEGKIKVHSALPPEPPAGEPGVFMGAELAHKDRFLPNFANRFNAPGQSITATDRDGNWSALFAGLPQDAILVIRHRVVFDMPLAVLDRVIVYPGGSLTFRNDISTELRLATLQVMKGGYLQVGTASNPIRDNVTAVITFRDKPINLDIDPGQYGNGLVNFGTVVMHGRALNRSWVRLATEPKAGDRVLTLSESVSGWMPGDKLILPDTQPISNMKTEENEIARVSGNLLFLARPLSVAHPGARSFAGTVEFLPHVGNLGRNVILRSENPNGVRGHTMHLGRAHTDLRYVALSELGRTKAVMPGVDRRSSHLHSTVFNADGTPSQIGKNQIGRYAIHFHHAIGPVAAPASGYQQVVIGLAVDGSPKWGIAIHGTHFGLFQDNVVYRALGAGIVTEDGSETENVISRNFVVGSIGSGTGATSRQLGLVDFAHEGAGFWFHSGNNRVVGNVAANNVAGFNDFRLSLPKTVTYPIARGDDPHMADQSLVDPAPTRMPFLDFNFNETYGGKVGLELWFNHSRPSGIDRKLNPRGDLRSGISTMKNSVIWHVSSKAVLAGGGQPGTFALDGLIVRMSNPSKKGPCVGSGISSSAAYTSYLEFRNIDIQGAELAIKDTRNGWVLENAFLQNCRNIQTDFAGGNNHTARNVRFAAVPGKPLHVATYLVAKPGQKFKPAQSVGLADPARFLMFDFQGIPGNNRELFLPEQLASAAAYSVFEPGISVGCPESGLTVRQCFDRYGFAPHGQPATCTGKDTGFITGASCSFGGSVAPAAQRNPQPRVLLTSPLQNAVLSKDGMGRARIFGVMTGDLANIKRDTAGNPLFYYQVDGGKVRSSDGYLRSQVISLSIGLGAGPHSIRAWLVDRSGGVVQGSEASLAFSVR